ncbi:MAG: AAA family ATPase [Flavobacteriales bacterium CG18_big_fil_WC_8_21_14_2_50_32_9]|nr:CbbQ/NirQ/NorQ/GpvN family protein [Flavobacteriales bacterium]PIQ15293.1 MAG: AAA family ATPase [Flavobacteriales bacterium CG18_big_fil_WC_8_21_14_2_50_32_9]PIZ05854.1 MAG: AAA family ATPase [Flavobacteriales bacterium CG_4_10_14_0_8_um_filter_32_5]PJC61640.1 MAG: AAA family ATPase [Flavobacteriales bacterium CG_4_9_14_0_2_um_filter_32_27]
MKTTFYKVIGKEQEIFEHTFKNKLPLLLKGPTGTGKSRFVEFMAEKLGKKLYTVACHEETSSTDLIGRYIIKGNETVWIDGPMTKAIKEGAFLYLDEIAEARPDIIVALHSLTDHRRALFIDKTGETIVADENFMLIATYNPGYQKGFKELKPSTRQRFISLSFNYPDNELEKSILIGETGVDEDVAKKLVKLGSKIRNLTELGLAETVSTRLLVDASLLIKSGLPQRLSCDVAIAEPLTDDEDTLIALKDLISLSM